MAHLFLFLGRESMTCGQLSARDQEILPGSWRGSGDKGLLPGWPCALPLLALSKDPCKLA